MKRIPITVEEAAADPTNVYEIRVSGDAAIASVTIHGDRPDGKGRWLYTQYANGGSTSGIPAHWPAFVRYVEDDDRAVPAVGDVVEFFSTADPYPGTARVRHTGTVTRVWTNGKYVSIRRTDTDSIFTRMIESVRIVMKGNGNG